jgi:hypothetical protein
VAVILSKIIGLDNIWTLPDDVESISDAKLIPHFPSPEELKFKYIVKCKTRRRVPACYKDQFNEEELKEYEPKLLTK